MICLRPTKGVEGGLLSTLLPLFRILEFQQKKKEKGRLNSNTGMV